MHYQTFELSRIGHGNDLGSRYLSDYPRLEPFYASDYRSSQSLAAHALKLQGRTWRSRFDRELAADLLKEYAQGFSAPEAVFANIDKLRNRQSVCVITGQQAGLGGGPLLVLYKALTALRLASELEAALAQPVVPLFWIASDDSDVEEANRFRVQIDSKLSKFRFNIPAGKLPVRDIALPQADDIQWQKLRELIPQGPGRVAALEILEQSAGKDFGTAFAQLMFRLLGPRGLVLIEPKALTSHPAWKRTLASEIDKREAHRLLLRRAADRLEALGLSAGVPITNQLNLFRHVKGERRRVSDGGAKLTVDGNESPMTKSALLSALKADAAGFSPSVLLRPVVQNAIFPTVAYVGGQAEIAYQGLLKGLHRATQTFMPALFPRLSMTLVESSDLPEFPALLDFRSKLQWRQSEAGVVFDSAQNSLRSGFAGLRQDLSGLAKPLASEISRLETKTLHSLNEVRGKVDRDPLGASGNSAHVARLLDRYFPEGQLQERELTLLGAFAKLGVKLLDLAGQVPNPFDFRHHVASI